LGPHSRKNELGAKERVGMEYTVNINGALVDEGQARVSVLDHGYLYGDGVFEGMRIYAGKILNWRNTCSGSTNRPKS
jgi:hypothetical protein